MKEKDIERELKLLKNKSDTPSNDLCNSFTSKVMDRIKNDSSFDDDYLDDISDMLYNLSATKDVNISSNFTENVMNRIKDYENSYQNIDNYLDLLKKSPQIAPKDDFTESVLLKIKNDINSQNSSSADIISFNSIYKKFLLGSTVVAAATILIAFNFFHNFNADMAEFMITDYFSTGFFK